MATHIKKLPAVLIDRIAAGEVVDGPHSVIKELVENALDAGADRIRVSTVAAGMDSILIEDNGRGIPYADLPLSIERHATSKITDLSDLEQITSFGFRGEALASIASVAHVEIQSRSEEVELGGRLECRGGELLQIEPQAYNPGTVIRVNELFYATPARRKYVKSERSENIRNMRTLTAIALAHPSVHMTYIRDGREYFDLLPVDTLAERVKSIFPERIQHHLVEVDYTAAGMSLTGVVADGDYYRANREGQYLFVNNRPVEVKHFSYLVKKSYGELLPPGAHPYYFLFLEIPPDRVDVNVHPAKREVRLLDESNLHGLVTGALETALRPRHPLQYSHEREQSRLAGHRMAHRYIQSVDQILFERPPAVRESFTIATYANSGSVGRDTTGRHSDSSDADRDYAPGNRQTIECIMHGDAQSGDDRFDTRDAPNPQNESSSAPARSFLPRKHFGTFYGAYIIAEGDDGLYIIDQHTAHERINYEKKRRQLEQVRGERQPLLQPIVIDCLEDELQQVLQHADELKESGFVVEEFGPRSYALREIPTYVEPGQEQDLIAHLIHRILEGEQGVRLYDEYAAMKACKASIKKNDYISGEVISELLVELANCENPSRCPHGRPTMVRITPEELDRMFHRI